MRPSRSKTIEFEFFSPCKSETFFQIFTSCPKLSLDGTKLPAGHPEGIFDSMANIYLGAAKAIRGKKYNDGEFPTMEDGVRGMNFIEATVESNKKKNSWVKMMK